jgi:hypothetical protein
MAIGQRRTVSAHQKQPSKVHSFDDLAMGLAEGTLSRRKALRLMGAALAGGMLASVPGVAWA